MDGPLLQQVGGWTAAITAAVGAAGGVALLRRKLSRDRTEMVKDRVESEFVQLLLRERDEALESAREAWRVRQVDAESIARLTSQNAYQQGEIERLKAEFAQFRRVIARMFPNTRVFLESDFAQFAATMPAPPPSPPPAAPPSWDEQQ